MTILPAALRLLAHFWLEEVRPDDLATLHTLPGLTEGLGDASPAALTALAVAYQRLLDFNLPPYESIFIDPSGMLLAPATARVQALYRQAQWKLPSGARVGAPDHLGAQLLALAAMLDAGQYDLARRLHTQHLALWLPCLVEALPSTRPHPFYRTLAELTLHLLLESLPPDALAPGHDPFPDLPPPTLYHDGGVPNEEDLRLADIARRLLRPREAGLYLTREELARLGHDLALPPVMGERGHMLETLLRSAGQYDLALALFERLAARLEMARATHRGWAADYPAYAPYAAAWEGRLAATHAALTDWRALLAAL